MGSSGGNVSLLPVAIFMKTPETMARIDHIHYDARPGTYASARQQCSGDSPPELWVRGVLNSDRDGTRGAESTSTPLCHHSLRDTLMRFWK